MRVCVHSEKQLQVLTIDLAHTVELSYLKQIWTSWPETFLNNSSLSISLLWKQAEEVWSVTADSSHVYCTFLTTDQAPQLKHIWCWKECMCRQLSLSISGKFSLISQHTHTRESTANPQRWGKSISLTAASYSEWCKKYPVCNLKLGELKYQTSDTFPAVTYYQQPYKQLLTQQRQTCKPHKSNNTHIV